MVELLVKIKQKKTYLRKEWIAFLASTRYGPHDTQNSFSWVTQRTVSIFCIQHKPCTIINQWNSATHKHQHSTRSTTNKISQSTFIIATPLCSSHWTRLLLTFIYCLLGTIHWTGNPPCLERDVWIGGWTSDSHVPLKGAKVVIDCCKLEVVRWLFSVKECNSKGKIKRRVFSEAISIVGLGWLSFYLSFYVSSFFIRLFFPLRVFVCVVS